MRVSLIGFVFVRSSVFLMMRVMSFVRCGLAALCCLLPGWVAAQDTLSVFPGRSLPEWTVEAVRGTANAASAPYALAVETHAPDVLPSATLSMERVVRSLPGVWVNDQGHFALGERISVRGMGARAPFGVRGMQVVLDGIPLTMPDGQTVLDVVESAVLRRTELLRSPAALFWGNGSGAVLFLASEEAAEASRFRAQALAGSFGQRRVLVEGRVPFGAHALQLYASNQRQEGYRTWSAGVRRRAGASVRLRTGAASHVRLLGALALQDTEHPGSLTREQFEADPTMARPAFADARAGKESVHAQTGIAFERAAGSGTLRITGYGVRRTLDNPLSFAYIDLGRTAGGARVALRQDRGRMQWGIGGDGALQHDIRKNFNNADGAPGENTLLNQVEDVTSAGAFAYGGFHLVRQMQIMGGLRYGTVRFAMDDRLLANGDQSGSRLFTAWSPMLGVSWRGDGWVLFANYGTAFETPTTTELVNRPDLTGGFNPSLDPQVTRGVEAGFRGALGPRLFVDAAVFSMHVDGRLISFENELGRDFFRNAGKNTHRGLEAAVQWVPSSRWEAAVAATASRLVFQEAGLKGNLLPGVPERRLFARVQTRPQDFRIRVEAEVVSEYFTNDANTAVNDGYVVFDASLGHEGFTAGSVRIMPFVEVRNVLDAQYSGSVSINAFGGRYYEPAPGRAFLAGLQLHILP